MLIKDVQVGGAFIVLIDREERVVVLGANANGEIGVGDTQARRQPAILEAIEDKQVESLSAGSCFAFAIGRPTSKVESTIIEESPSVQN